MEGGEIGGWGEVGGEIGGWGEAGREGDRRVG